MTRFHAKALRAVCTSVSGTTTITANFTIQVQVDGKTASGTMQIVVTKAEAQLLGGVGYFQVGMVYEFDLKELSDVGAQPRLSPTGA